MPEPKLLKDAINEILDAIVSKLTTAIAENKLDAVSIVRGDRDRPNPKMPSVWVFVEECVPNHDRRTLYETWELIAILTPVLTSNIPEEGYVSATSIAAQARTAVIKGRTLDRSYVQDVRSGRFEPSAPWHREGNKYSALAAVKVIFNILEY